MKVLLVLGKHSKLNANKLKEQADSLEVFPYVTLDEMIDNVTQRNLKFDRIVLTNKILPDEMTMTKLHRFLKRYHPRATVVFLLGSTVGVEIAQSFNRIFNSPLYTDMIIERSSISALQVSAVESTDIIREQYSVSKYGEEDDEVIEDEYEEETDSEDTGEYVHDYSKNPMRRLPQNTKQRKLYGLFGKKKLNKKERRILNENLQVISGYVKFLRGMEDGMGLNSKPISRPVVKGFQSNPIEEYEIEKAKLQNEQSGEQESPKNSTNLDYQSTFTPLEFGYYGFSAEFEGRPMLLRTGVRVKQQSA